ncbi:MAG TPA: pyridoxamine kinase [Erysipelotrichaceae bacterium]|nr:pyridoxamine kinase [Erysipelotrichaceae bacterium]HQA84992.1 pyridoxamine kinase [Erysipelotrichaceae bacterium]
MNYKRVLTIQDISCVGQCSLTVALPVLSSCGVETAILPSAVLSTHTGGFEGYTFRDLTDDMMPIADHWQKENLMFDTVYSGYLGSARQIDYVIEITKRLLKEGGYSIVDPAMADNGKLYYGFNLAFVEEMKKLVFSSDICIPNITEACFLTDTEYKENYDQQYTYSIVDKLSQAGAKTIVLTGVSYDEDTTGVLILENGIKSYYRHKKIDKKYHGTGDIYSSAFTGALNRGKSVYESAKIAADFVVKCIENTIDDESHWYGVKFEPVLYQLSKEVLDL